MAEDGGKKYGGGWESLEGRVIFEHPVLRLRCDRYRLRRDDGECDGADRDGTVGAVEENKNTVEGDFLSLEMRSWVNVVARTTDERFVMVRQFRHGTQQMSLETPGGIIDADESPETAALRELREETGYTTDQPLLRLGAADANPALQTNRGFFLLAEGCRRMSTQERACYGTRPDSLERIDVELLTRDELASKIHHGLLSHSWVLLSLALYEERRRYETDDGRPGLLFAMTDIG